MRRRLGHDGLPRPAAVIRSSSSSRDTRVVNAIEAADAVSGNE